ncbi:MAG TPA: DUF378 domain-containing protein [Polyangiales bacterium]|nr:DUF378 domain-containing protein [Polyangiales bacterium]
MATATTDKPASNAWFKILLFIAIIGAVNWGLIGFFNWNLVDALFGGGVREETSTGSRIVYALVGLSGLLSLIPLLSRHTEMTGPGAHRI